MPYLKTYDLFISHAWKYNDDYYRLINLLQNADYFKFRNYSVPEHDPLIDPGTPIGTKKLEALIDKQIKPVNCVMIVSGMYAAHKHWLQKEITIAQSYAKPIIAVAPIGQVMIPVFIQEAAHAIVRWNTDSIVTAIRKHSI